MNYKKIYSTIIIVLACAFIGSILFLTLKNKNQNQAEGSMEGYAGSESCKTCHERFYDLWSPSHHGKAMQPVDSVFIQNEVTAQAKMLSVGESNYQMVFENDSMFCMEYVPDSMHPSKLPVVWALGGRNVYYFLTPWKGGRLQTLPLAFDVNTKEWYNNPASGVRHFVDMDVEDAAVDWRHSLYTFNTTCHSCHVSQLEKNYNQSENSYHTIWKEPGINCEACHGPSALHAEVLAKAAKEGRELELSEMEIITTSTFTPEQHNSSCSPCHAKMAPITTSYPPGDPFYDHFNLVTLENIDFYPDGRDLGENYTFSSWSMNECQMNSDLNCVTCHTSSGRNRFAVHEDANNACIKCHQDNVENFEQHSHHKVSDQLTCVSCHMPKTMFARMSRSDHSFRPPMPQTTIAFGSPNACNICHEDKTPQWANKHVTEWKGKGFQKETLYYGELIKAARDKNDFSRSDEMLKMIKENKPNEIFVASMIRLLEGREMEGKQEALLSAVSHNSSPLVRSAAVEGLRGYFSEEIKQVLLLAAQDSIRLVRVSAGSVFANIPDQYLNKEEIAIRNKAFADYKASITARPDHWSSHFNLGNFNMGRREFDLAIESYKMANKLEPEAISSYVNASLAYSNQENYYKAEESLQKALEYAPENAVANANYGLLLGELGRFGEAKKAYRTALQEDPEMLTAAYNLSIVLASDPVSKDSIGEVLRFSKLAYEIAPNQSKYSYTYAYYLSTAGKIKKAIQIGNEAIKSDPNFIDGYLFLEQMYKDADKQMEISAMYKKALNNVQLSPQSRQYIMQRTEMMRQN